MYTLIFKRVIDLIVSFILLLLASPIIIPCTILLFIVNSGKPFFTQKRPGKNAHVFTIIKFKTMNDKRDSYGNLLPDADRLTPIGLLIRKTSIDELLQLINVLKGDMSLIGPRPLLVDYLSLYNERQAKRHLVKPGISGWAQVNGRNTLNWPERFELDVYYVEHISLLLDLKIFFLTILKIFIREGISQQGDATMPPFTGNN